MYLDSPDDAISDEFDSLIFYNHTLGNNILGTQESVKSTTRDAFLAFVAQHLNTEKLVLATVGPMTMDQVMRTVGQQLESKPRSTPDNPRTAFGGYVPQTITQEKPITQAHVLMGCPALAYTHPDRLPLVMLTNMLGGPAMNSRLNLAVREKHGLTYAIEAGFTPYGDTGIFSIYYGTEPRQINRVQRLVKQELRKLREKPLGITQMRQVQEQLKGQLAMSEESNLNLCLALGKSLLDAGRMESLPEIFNQIDAIKPSQLADLANQFFNEEGLSTLIYVPEEE
jgi:predicted Zn-dependent peptidase